MSAPISGGDLNGDSWIDIVVSGYKWPPELQIPHYAINLNNNSYFPGFGNEWNDTLPTGYIYATEVVDINNDSRQDIIHCGEGVYITLSSDTTSSVSALKLVLFDFHLSQNFPNPFNSLTSMNLESNENGIIRISVYNILGEEVRLLEDKSFTKGNHILEWDGKSEEMLDLPSGIYIIQAKSKEHIQQIKVLLLK